MDARVEDIYWSVNDYNCDGDERDSGVYLHIDTARVKVANNYYDFTRFVDHVAGMKEEILRAWQQQDKVWQQRNL